MTNLNNKNNNHSIAIATTISVLAIVIILVSIRIVVPAAATAATTTTAPPAGNTTTSSSSIGPSSGIKLSSQPVYQKHSPPGNIIPINQTYIGATHSGNGTLTLPNSTQSIKFTTINGTALISLATSSVQIKETLRAENGETVNVTGYEIIHFNNPAAAPLGGGRSIVTAILQTNSTGILAPFNGMILAGIDDFAPDGDSHVRLWMWESGMLLPTGNTTATEQSSSSSSLMNTTTTTTNATTITSGTNATAATDGEGSVGEEEQQQCELGITSDKQIYKSGDIVTITVINNGDHALDFPDTSLGLGIQNLDTGDEYPIFSGQAITTIQPGKSETFRYNYEDLVSEIGTGTIEFSVSGYQCSASNTFMLA